MHYQARYYDPLTARFTQPDTIVPDPTNPQDLNRYTYVRNNPATHTDPTGNRLVVGNNPRTGKTIHHTPKNYRPYPTKKRASGANDRAVKHRSPRNVKQLYRAPARKKQQPHRAQKKRNRRRAQHKARGTATHRRGRQRKNDAFHVDGRSRWELLLEGGLFAAIPTLQGLADMLAPNPCPRIEGMEGCVATGIVVPPGGAASAADDILNGVRLRAQLTGKEIAGGHAFQKHVITQGEFPAITTRKQFASLIEDVVTNGEMRPLMNGRTAYWRNGTVVIRNPNAVDGGTAFRPTNGYKYFVGLH